MNIPLRGDPTYQKFEGPKFLHRALAVVRFSSVLKIADETGAGIGAFQDAVRSLYPFAELEYEQALRFELHQDGTIESHQERHAVWRLQDKQRNWRVSLSATSVALDVQKDGYSSWSEFSGRMNQIIDEVAKHFAPSVAQNVGVRLVNLASISKNSDPRLHCRKELVSITGNPDLQHADLHWRFNVDEGILILRSGLLSPGSSYDPMVVEPNAAPHWYLDIDVVNADIHDFEADRIKLDIEAQSKRGRAIYAWAMSGLGQA